MRDTQRQRLYDAEAQVGHQLDNARSGARLVEVAGSTVALPLELRFGTLETAQRYVDGVRAGAGFAALFPRAADVPLRVRRRAGGRAAHYEAPDTIALHDSGRSLRELVVLHEVAHHAGHHDLPSGPPHGPAFAGAFLRLAGDILGPAVGLLLAVAYEEHGVAVAPLAGAGAGSAAVQR